VLNLPLSITVFLFSVPNYPNSYNDCVFQLISSCTLLYLSEPLADFITSLFRICSTYLFHFGFKISKCPNPPFKTFSTHYSLPKHNQLAEKSSLPSPHHVLNFHCQNEHNTCPSHRVLLAFIASSTSRILSRPSCVMSPNRLVSCPPAYLLIEKYAIVVGIDHGGTSRASVFLSMTQVRSMFLLDQPLLCSFLLSVFLSFTSLNLSSFICLYSPINPTPQIRPYPLHFGDYRRQTETPASPYYAFLVGANYGSLRRAPGSYSDHLSPYLSNTNLDYPRIFYYPNTGFHTTFNALSCYALLHCHISFAKLLA